ncbi:phosphoribosylamine--glycine ligase [Thermosyntropha lipolytica DSM 11003]|uniref:Phosphoribosylamine--glycine ligase n=1 Tax=Thermosyntropha lipolytica DSM 11003 TaxID=1123382 RepID=A0A1M5J9I1_9FIRM|nr:phosphoribosylamine--glycine ligase [Thermosyntropha lipolytica]SHG37234.1 phosphoribosylamine--glycine ligase [Thermosyntropha lipolytica DSM 11003]
MGKKVLVVGQGGREHALVWKLSLSPQVEKIYAAPGNPGIGQIAECVDIGAEDIDKLAAFAREKGIDLTVVGPEAPLMQGIADIFKEKGLLLFGPSRAAARLEGSKAFTKNLLKKYGIPTASYEVFTDAEQALDWAEHYTNQGKKVVIKADGLAAGKGVVIAETFAQAREAIEDIMIKKTLGSAGDKVVIEEFLEGEEVSVFALSDGEDFVILGAAQDHKQVFDGDKGPNTGGMGAYVNPPLYDEKLAVKVREKIIAPVIAAMKEEGTPYAGVLYAGLMVRDGEPKVLEFNARFGDPEAQVLLPMIKDDIYTLLEKVARGELDGYVPQMEEGSCICVVLASGGYPGPYEKGKEITGLNNISPDTLLFHAGTALKDGKLVTNGGRVLNVVCRGQNIEECIDKVYKEVAKVSFAGMHYRRDIGYKALKRKGMKS